MNQAPICVVGMHRSGTSLAARVLAALGVNFGDQSSMLPADPSDNPEGYQEQLPIMMLNDELLRALGGHASEPPMLEPGWELSGEIQLFAARARELIDELYDERLWAFKDPRASLLLPFWRSVIPKLRVLVCIRNPLEVANSMDLRDDPYPLEHWIEMWARHTDDALNGSEGCDRMLLTYDDLLAQPKATANALARFALGHDADPTSLAAAAALPRPQSRRSTIDSQSLIRDPRVPSEIALRYFELRSSGSIDSRASNPITTQPSAALLNSRHGS